MSGFWGERIKLSVFGESHGPAVGVVIDGLKSGLMVDFEEIRRRMKKRAPGGDLATPRKEADEVKILSGMYNGCTQGTPIAAVIENTNVKSADYDNLRNIPRPSHADYAALLKYGGFADMRGGGHFSGRLTAPIVFAGALCMQALAKEGVTIGARLAMAGGVRDKEIDYGEETAKLLDERDFPVFDAQAARDMQAAIIKAKEEDDSIGGIVELFAAGMKQGLGGPLFEGAEGRLASSLFGIPAVKGVEFGGGFSLASMRGSQANDALETDAKGGVAFKTNNSGGIQGGITTGAPVIARVAFKPTPSIAKEQASVDLASGEDAKISIHGRHDPCVALRGVYAAQAAFAIALLDMIYAAY
jgi:chorismate synthase